MRILFTGASSFTGHWFVKTLAAAGHEVVATFRRPLAAYEGLRARRVNELAGLCRPVECGFGDQAFLELVSAGGWDLLCHHAAEVTDYKSADFNVMAAVESNTRNVRAVLTGLRAGGCIRVLLTGSVFECDEGTGGISDLGFGIWDLGERGPVDDRRAFSPYGLSKAITAQVFRYYAEVSGLTLGKFVIPNPFGPLEEPRFTGYLAKSWFAGQTAVVATPDYVRDNIHVSLLAAAYRGFAESLPNPGKTGSLDAPNFLRLNPSGYAQGQAAFARRFAAELRPRLGLACALEFKDQDEFAEPRVRINTDRPDAGRLGWDEARAWDDLAGYYRQVYGSAAS